MTPTLSPRQRYVLEEMWAGRSQKEIAASIGVSAKTVQQFATRARQKFQARTTIELMRKAVQQGVLTA